MVKLQAFELVDQSVARVRPMVEQLANDLWQCAELSLLEVKSAQMCIDRLREEGFTITSKGSSHIPTAFIAEWGNEGPILGFLAEYDALPGLGNECVPYKKPREDHVTSGHGCGHNLLGAGTIGAAVALKSVMTQLNIPGTIRLYGCPAEETEGAKTYMAREGLFNNVDAALCWHPSAEAEVNHVRSLAVNKMIIEFFGKEAHAGLSPWLGRSAVHAAELFAHGLSLMREHLEPTARLHYVYEKAGEVPNIIPNYARLRLYVRDSDHERVAASTTWIKQICEGAACATQTRTKSQVYIGNYDLLPNTPLARCMQAHLERIGVPAYTSEELAFAKDVQHNSNTEPYGMTIKALPLPDDTLSMSISTDVGDVSWCTPTIGCSIPTVPRGIAMHTWAATACHGTSIGCKGALLATKVLTATALDFMTNMELRQAARTDFEQRTGGKSYVSLIPSDMKYPTALPEWMLTKPVLQ